MVLLSPAQNVRRLFLRFGKLTSLIAFVVICGDVLLDQWVWGAPNAWFVFGTMCLIAAACITLFAFIALIGLVTSLAFHDGLLGQSQTTTLTFFESRSASREPPRPSNSPAFFNRI